MTLPAIGRFRASIVRSAANPEIADEREIPLQMRVSEGPKDGLGFIPGIFSKPHRADENVHAMTALVVDLDGVDDLTLARIRAALEVSGLEFGYYETHSHGRDGRNCARVILPFAEHFPVIAADWKATRAAILRHLGLVADADPSCSNPSRFYYLPRHPAGETRRSYHRPGKRLDWRPFASTAAIVPAAERAEFPPATNEDLANAAAEVQRLGPAIEGEGGDTHTFVVCALLVHNYALSIDEALELLEPWNAKCQPPWDPYALAEKLRNAAKYAKGEYGDRRKTDGRPAIQIVAGKLAELATEAERVLISRGAQIYQRGGRLVRPVTDEVQAAHGQVTKVSRLRDVTPTYLRDLLSREIRWQRWDARAKALMTADPPTEIANLIIERDGEWGFKVIAGVVTTPTLRPDGTILSTPGYDESTHLLLIDPPAMPEVELTREMALKALASLNALLDEFPFVDAASRSVALSAILTAVARGGFDVAPAHAASASTAGTGKSYLWDIAAAICIGQRCPVLTAPRDDAELEKRLGSAMVTGQPIISLDNMSVALGGDALAQLIERQIVDVRILGETRLARVESRASVFATGNNLTVMGDVTRRVLLCRLEANLERPELRQFAGDPFAKVIANRGKYVAAALTIVAAYAKAGRPDYRPRLASFGGWSDTVRSALVWLGCADPCATMETARQEDPLLALQRAVLSTWAKRIGIGKATARTAADVLRLAQTFEDQEFAQAINDVASNRGTPEARTLGKWLSRHKQKIVGGLRLCVDVDAHGHAGKWWLERCG